MTYLFTAEARQINIHELRDLGNKSGGGDVYVWDQRQTGVGSTLIVTSEAMDSTLGRKEKGKGKGGWTEEDRKGGYIYMRCELILLLAVVLLLGQRHLL